MNDKIELKELFAIDLTIEDSPVYAYPRGLGASEGAATIYVYLPESMRFLMLRQRQTDRVAVWWRRIAPHGWRARSQKIR